MKIIFQFFLPFSFCVTGVMAQSVSDIDGNLYDTVSIGTQVWLKQNLKTTRYNDGSEIPMVKDNMDWMNATEGGYCWFYNNDTIYGKTYGALYNWYAVDKGNLCPAGWHVPSDMEWQETVDYLGGINEAGNKLKETGTTHWQTLNLGATNESGFTALPGSYRNSDGMFGYIGFTGYWWTATVEGGYNVWNYSINGDANGIQRDFHDKALGFSVRCLKGEGIYCNISPTTLILSPDSGSTELSVHANTDWTISVNKSWIRLEKLSGSYNDTITVLVDANPITIYRMAYITLTSKEGESKTIQIEQLAAKPYITVSDTLLTMDYVEGSSASFDISTNAYWKITCDQTWLTPGVSSGSQNATIFLSASRNTESAIRPAKITISIPGLNPTVIHVNQNGFSSGTSDIINPNISIFPIPVNEKLVLSFEKQVTDARLVMYTLGGEIVLLRRLEAARNEINMNNQKPGLYIVKIFRNDEVILSRKIVKQ